MGGIFFAQAIRRSYLDTCYTLEMRAITGIALAIVSMIRVGEACGDTGGPGLAPLLSEGSGSQLWKLQSDFSDEFNGAVLDTGKWNNDPEDWGVWSWGRSNARVEEGLLKITMVYDIHKRGWQTLFYKSGIIRSRQRSGVRYGFFEARIKAARRYPGVCPAFWAYRKEEERWTEIDFVELTQRLRSSRIVDFFAHAFRLPGLAGPIRVGHSFALPLDPREEFHVYGAEWGEDEISWYVDGRKVHSTPNTHWHQPLDVVLSLGVREPLKNAPSRSGFPVEFHSDYIRVWQVER